MRNQISAQFPDALIEEDYLRRVRERHTGFEAVCTTVCREASCSSACEVLHDLFDNVVEWPSLGGVPTLGRTELGSLWNDKVQGGILFVALTHVTLRAGELSACFALETLRRQQERREQTNGRSQLQLDADDLELGHLRNVLGPPSARDDTPTSCELAKRLAVQARSWITDRVAAVAPPNRPFDVVTGVQVHGADETYLWLTPDPPRHT